MWAFLFLVLKHSINLNFGICQFVSDGPNKHFPVFWSAMRFEGQNITQNVPLKFVLSLKRPKSKVTLKK